MKKLVLLAAGVAALALGSACNRQKCPAYTSTKEASRVSSPIMASNAKAVERQ
jgi:hypothetical protein